MSRALVACLLALIWAAPCLGFNDAGHRICAAIAWRKLDAAHRAAIVNVLRSHPRFQEDFKDKMPPQVASQPDAVKDQWIFCQAAVWPDIARDQPEYHRGKWHYINLPVFLSAAQAAALGDDLDVNLEFALPSAGEVDEEDYNAVQAVKSSLNILATETDDEVRAVHYCWLLHVIPDLAQPLHSSALFTQELYPDGDRGGGRVKITRPGTSGSGKKLHGIWDGLLGSSSNFNAIQSSAVEIIEDHQALFNAPVAGLPEDVWATEYLQVALQSAYGPLLSELREQEDDGGPAQTISVSEGYFTQAGSTARRQAAIAGSRLAGVLASTLEPDGPTPFAFTAPGLKIPAAIAMVDSGAAHEPSPFRRRLGLESSIEGRLQRLEEEISTIREELAEGVGGVDRSSSLVLGVTEEETEESEDECSCGSDE